MNKILQKIIMLPYKLVKRHCSIKQAGFAEPHSNQIGVGLDLGWVGFEVGFGLGLGWGWGRVGFRLKLGLGRVDFLFS